VLVGVDGLPKAVHIRRGLDLEWTRRHGGRDALQVPARNEKGTPIEASRTVMVNFASFEWRRSGLRATLAPHLPRPARGIDWLPGRAAGVEVVVAAAHLRTVPRGCHALQRDLPRPPVSGRAPDGGQP